MNDRQSQNRMRGGRFAAILLGIALCSLLATLAFVTPHPDAVAMQPGQTLLATSSPTVISPLQLPTSTRRPTPTATRRPSPTPRRIEPVTEPTEAWVLIHRPGFAAPPAPTGGSIPEAKALTYADSHTEQLTLRYYLPTILDSGLEQPLWRKGVDRARPNPSLVPTIPTEGPDVTQLDVYWYYDWSHANLPFTDGYFAPMIWCGIKPSDGLAISPLDAAVIATQVAQYPGRTWLGFNEADHPVTMHPTTEVFSFGQCAYWFCQVVHAQHPELPCAWGGKTGTPTPNPTVTAALATEMVNLAVERFVETYEAIKGNDPTAKVFCCGNFFAHNTSWWTAFKDRLRDVHPTVKIDGVAIYAYPWSISTGCDSVILPRDAWACIQDDLEGFVSTHAAELDRPDSVLAPARRFG